MAYALIFCSSCGNDQKATFLSNASSNGGSWFSSISQDTCCATAREARSSNLDTLLPNAQLRDSTSSISISALASSKCSSVSTNETKFGKLSAHHTRRNKQQMQQNIMQKLKLFPELTNITQVYVAARGKLLNSNILICNPNPNQNLPRS